MKMIIAFAALVAVAIAAPVDSDVVLVNETPSDNIGLGDYKYGYQLSDGATKEESAHFVDGPEGPVPEVRGSWTWINPADNQPIVTSYVAGVNGFQVEGAHIPV